MANQQRSALVTNPSNNAINDPSHSNNAGTVHQNREAKERMVGGQRYESQEPSEGDYETKQRRTPGG